MTENKTKPNDADVQSFVANVDHPRRRADAEVLLALMGQVTGMKPQMWGDSIVGYGQYHYKYASGWEGDYFLTGFSPRKAAMTIYIMPGFKQYGDLLAKLGKHRHSSSCLYISRLETIDLAILEAILADSVRRMKEIYPQWSKKAGPWT
ncbi:MAG: DUF1801 domain-containing protein [Proteobacteria bacterium]|nr:DUF1801 domain-containing protein [Pseudomonadota bacterium]